MKNRSLVLALASVLLVSACTQVPSNNEYQIADGLIGIAEDYRINEASAVTKNLQIGNGEEISVSPTYVQYGTMNYEGSEIYVMRYATAIKGKIESISYEVEAFADKESTGSTSVSVVYRSIYADDEIQYYSDEVGLTTDEAYAGDYYWACYSIRYVSGDKYKDEDITVNLNINSEQVSTRTASLSSLFVHTHELSKVDAKEATALLDGCAEYYKCSGCEELFKDANGEQSVTLDELRTSAWKSMADIEGGSVPSADGTIKFAGKNSSAYLDNFFVDSEGDSISGDGTKAPNNTQYTMEATISATDTFVIALFANAETQTAYEEGDVSAEGVAPKWGFYLTFNAETGKIGIKAAVGNGNSSSVATKGNKAQSVEDTAFKFDGTENNLKITVERFIDENDNDLLMVEVNVNDTLLTFKKTNTNGIKVCGFSLRPEWDRTQAGSSYTKKDNAYSTVGVGFNDGTTLNIGNGLAIAPVTADGTETAAEVVLSSLSLTKTADPLN